MPNDHNSTPEKAQRRGYDLAAPTQRIRHRVFARCGACGRDAARWEDGDGWWHLDGDVAHGHAVTPPAEGGARLLAVLSSPTAIDTLADEPVGYSCSDCGRSENPTPPF